MKFIKEQTIVALLLVLSTGAGHAGWQLQPDSSHIHFVSVKKSKIAEVHTFKQVAGRISDKGAVNVKINLDSVETLIPIRNERMRKMLFETAVFPEAELSTQIDTALLDNLKPGQTINRDVDVKISLHGKNLLSKTSLQLVGLQDKRVSVSTIRPVILNMGDFDLVAGVEKLREAAKLPSISIAVPGTAYLLFSKE